MSISGFFKNEYTECKKCGLDKNCKSPRMNYGGKGIKKCLILGEASGAKEDELGTLHNITQPGEGTQFVGSAGNKFREKLAKYNLDLDVHFWKQNVVNCRPPKNRKPTKKEMKLCWSNIEKTIKDLKPDHIWLVGGASIESFFTNMYQGRFKKLAVNTWRGFHIPDRKLNCWVSIINHPSALLHNKDKGLEAIFDRDLARAVSNLGKPLAEFEDFSKSVELLIDFDLIKQTLIELRTEATEMAFDYETNAIKPYKEGSRILCASVFDGNKSYAFPIDHPVIFNKDQKDVIMNLWFDILRDDKIAKIAQNMSFEESWSRTIIGTEVANWYWDTMLYSHIADARGGISGLKFQAYVRYGIDDYSASVNSYMTEAPNGFNRLDKVPLDKLLYYNALDSILTYRLYKDQRRELDSMNRNMKAKTLKIYNLFHDGTLALCDAQEAGVQLDMDYFNEQQKTLDDRIDTIMSEIDNSIEARRFERYTGKKINWDSSKDLRELLFDVLKLESYKQTSSGANSVDAEVLSTIEIEPIKKLLEYRKLFKARNTYLSQFFRYAVEGKIHPSFNLHIARTGRSSSSGPNLHNIPVREESVKKMTRGGIIPSKGNKLMEVDFGALEVRGIAFYGKDPELIKDIADPHTYWAKEVFMVTDEQKTKKLRFYTKNQFVFPEFYGSWYVACTGNLWKNCMELKTGDDITVREHLRNKGIKDYNDFEDHIQRIENKFWTKFKVTKEWQNRTIEDYIKKGYVDTFFGFRRTGYLSKNEIINAPIQGTCFHILLSCFVELNRRRREENWKSKMIGQIHDSILFDLHPEEEDYVIKTTKYIMETWIREQNPWIIVPLLVEFEITDIDQAWYYKEEIKV